MLILLGVSEIDKMFWHEWLFDSKMAAANVCIGGVQFLVLCITVIVEYGLKGYLQVLSST